MIVSISAVVLLGVAVFLTIRQSRHKLWHALLAILFGFYLAKTGAAPAMASGVAAVIGVFAHLHL